GGAAFQKLRGSLAAVDGVRGREARRCRQLPAPDRSDRGTQPRRGGPGAATGHREPRRVLTLSIRDAPAGSLAGGGRREFRAAIRARERAHHSLRCRRLPRGPWTSTRTRARPPTHAAGATAPASSSWSRAALSPWNSARRLTPSTFAASSALRPSL